MNARQDIAHRSRTGNKIHGSYVGSSVSFCGYWAKVQTSKLRVRGTVRKSNLCEKCFGANPSPEYLESLGLKLAD